MDRLKPSTVIKLKDANIVDVLSNVRVENKTGGYCETCFYEYEVLETKVDFKLENGTLHNFIHDEEIDIDYQEDSYMTTADLFNVFLDMDFLNQLKEVELKDFNNVLAKRMYLMFIGHGEKRGLIDMLEYKYYDFLKEEIDRSRGQ